MFYGKCHDGFLHREVKHGFSATYYLLEVSAESEMWKPQFLVAEVLLDGHGDLVLLKLSKHK
jgi:hypothetical protein